MPAASSSVARPCFLASSIKLFAFIQSLQAQQPEIDSLNNNDDYQRLTEAKVSIEKDLQTAIDACFNEENHPAEFRNGGMTRDSICNMNARTKITASVESFLQDTDENTYGLESVIASNNEAKYYFKYASLKIYPIKEKLSKP